MRIRLPFLTAFIILVFAGYGLAAAPYTGGNVDGYSSSSGYSIGIYYGGSYDGYGMSTGSTSDTDQDGLTDLFENLLSTCTAYDDADTDDDGLLDAWEDANRNGIVDSRETDPCEADTDGDGIQDGTERGLTEADIGPDTNLSMFVPDADPSTKTKPYLADTDFDGILDGDEDLNFNGRVDPGESDPNPRKNIAMPWIPLLLIDE
jgi:hypothetical protein